MLIVCVCVFVCVCVCVCVWAPPPSLTPYPPLAHVYLQYFRPFSDPSLHLDRTFQTCHQASQPTCQPASEGHLLPCQD